MLLVINVHGLPMRAFPRPVICGLWAFADRCAEPFNTASLAQLLLANLAGFRKAIAHRSTAALPADVTTPFALVCTN